MGPEHLVVVEAKTLTHEHDAAQTNKRQTEVYIGAVRAAHGARRHELTVLLTMDATPPEHVDAVASTFATFAFAILSALADLRVRNEESWPYRLLATHWLMHTVADVRVRDLVCIAERIEQVQDDALLELLDDVTQLERLVPLRGAA
jgi:hypothetical protein